MTSLVIGLATEPIVERQVVAQCEELIDYHFNDPNLLVHALTHASVAPTRLESNERLEFLGDAVLGLCVCSYLFQNHAELLEGEMTKIKSSVVSRRTCAIVARECGIAEMLLLSGDMAGAGGMPESVAAAVFESIIGAIYIDGGYEQASQFILRHLMPFLEEALETSHHRNFKSLLQQHVQRLWSSTPDYVLLDEQGPDHSKCFEVAVVLDGRHFASAWGRSKKTAEQAAARSALIELELITEEEAGAAPDFGPDEE
jgi:ribonuclease-3